MSNTAWSFAVLVGTDEPLLSAIASQARRKLTFGDTQALSNTAWAFATLLVKHEPLMDAIAAESRRRITQFDEQGCANTAFAFAALGLWHHEPLMNAIAAQAISLIADSASVPPAGDPLFGRPARPGQQFRHLLDTLSSLVELNRC